MRLVDTRTVDGDVAFLTKESIRGRLALSAAIARMSVL
jgi:hypothetical protein